MTFQPCKVNFDGTRAKERAPVCGMSREDAAVYALTVWGEDAGVIDDDSGHVTWVGDRILAQLGDYGDRALCDDEDYNTEEGA